MSDGGGENGWAPTVDLRRLGDGGAPLVDAVRRLLASDGGLVIVENVFDGGEAATVPDLCAWMEDTMAALGSRSKMSDFSGTPVDPEADGGHEDFKPAIVPGHPHIRVLGNTSSEGRPTSLVCHLGYQWHQDGYGTARADARTGRPADRPPGTEARLIATRTTTRAGPPT